MSRWLHAALMSVCLSVVYESSPVKADEANAEPIATVEFQPLSAATSRLLDAIQFQHTHQQTVHSEGYS